MRPLSFGLLLAIGSGLSGGEPTAATRLRLHAAAAPQRTSAHLLLPTLSAAHPGNAALFYERSLATMQQQSVRHRFNDLLDKPLAQVPPEQLRQLLEANAVFEELGYAARCESCDWHLLPRLRKDGYTLLLPDVQGLREAAQLLGLKARHEADQGKFEQALHTLQTGLALSRHLNESPALIKVFVSQSIAHLMLNAVEELVQQPGAPNLYWALRDLPTPFLDVRRPLQGERLALRALFPEIYDQLDDKRFQPVAHHTIRAGLERLGRLSGRQAHDFAAQAGAIYSQAKGFFLDRGHASDELDALPVTQLAILYSLAQWNLKFDEFYRWQSVPYWQAHAGLKKASEDPRGLRLVDLLVPPPAAAAVIFHRTRLDRRIAALQCIEAVRLYAAAHGGRLPNSLEAITEAPIPLDPFTGRLFEYSVSDGVARLLGPALPGEPEDSRNVLHYQLTIARDRSSK